MTKLTAAVLALALPCALLAQQPVSDTTKPAPPPSPAPAAPAPTASVSIPVDFPAVLYPNFQYRGDKGAAHSANKFDLERAYLTFRMPAGDRASIRITADVFQQTTAPQDAFYRGWVVRAKYAYLQYDLIKSSSWNANIRGGLLHNVVIDHIEQFWPRWLSQSPVERAGFFSSSDAGVATTLSFPNKLGEIYATVVNGPGYTSREVDRFKDYAARLSLTPLRSWDNKIIKTLALSGWTYIGAAGSAFANGGPAQGGAVGVPLSPTQAGGILGERG